MSEITLGIDTLNKEEWRDNAFNTYNSVDTDFYLGALNPHSQATMKLITKHGNAFESVRSDYQATFIFDNKYYIIDLKQGPNGLSSINDIYVYSKNGEETTFSFIGVENPNRHSYLKKESYGITHLNDGYDYYQGTTATAFLGNGLEDRFLIKTKEPLSQIVLSSTFPREISPTYEVYSVKNFNKLNINENDYDVDGLYDENNIVFLNKVSTSYGHTSIDL